MVHHRAYGAKKKCDFVIPYRTLPGVGGGGPEISGLRDFRRFLRAISSKVGPPEAEIFEDLGRCFKQKTRSKCTLEHVFPVKTLPHHPKNVRLRRTRNVFFFRFLWGLAQVAEGTVKEQTHVNQSPFIGFTPFKKRYNFVISCRPHPGSGS